MRLTEDAVGFFGTFTLLDGDGVAVNLTDSTVTFYCRNETGTTHGPFACTISGTPSHGIVTYTTVGTEIDTGGRWTGQFRIRATGLDVGSRHFDIVADDNLF